MYLYSKRRIILLFASPVLLIFVFYTLIPLLHTAAGSFFRIPLYAGFSQWQWYGLRNFERIFADPVFLRAILNNFTILAVSLAVCIPLGFLVGMLFMQKLSGGGLIKTLIFLPYIMSGILIGTLWSFVLDPGTGLINGFLGAVGLGALKQVWIGGPYLTPVMAALISAWAGCGYYGVLFMSGMKMMPKDTLEAAVVDGASGWQRTTRVIIPMLKETFKTVTVLVIVNSLNAYEVIRMLTNGGPNQLSTTLAMYIYNVQFGQVLGGDVGRASAMCVVMAVLVLGLSVSFLHATRKRLED